MNNLSEIWNQLEKEAVTAPGDGTLTQHLFSKLGLSIGLEVKTRNKLLLLEIENSNEVDSSQFPQWEGVKTDLITLGSKEVIVLILEDEECLHIFNSLINDFYNALQHAKDKLEAYRLFIEILFRWYGFFKKFGTKVLSETKLRGIFGELYFLSNYLLQKYDALSVIKSWQGPDKMHHDFTFLNGNVEVKSTIRKAHKKVTIANEKQMDDTGLPFLYLYCITLNIDSNNGESLPEIVIKIRDILSDNYIALQLFNNALGTLGYNDEHSDIYGRHKYIFTKDYLFHVRKGFPRITEVDEGVGDVKYSLVISSCMGFISDIESSLKGLLQNEN